MAGRKSITERFWAKVDKNGPMPTRNAHLGQCWNWTGARDSKGRGRFGLQRDDGSWNMVMAPRVAWLLGHGEDCPSELYVCHHCDNPTCVRLSHLFTGDHLRNMKDRAEAGRAAHVNGEANGQAKITRDDVREIFALQADGVSQRKIAAQVGLSQTHVGHILRGTRWGWLRALAAEIGGER
jgi:hypothetical protein